MSLSTQLVAGLASGFDWRTMIDELIALEHRRVDLVEDRKSEYEAQLAEWQSFNTKLLSLKTAAEGLKDPRDFYVYTASMSSDSSTVEASDLLSVSTSSYASKSSYSITDISLATAQKLSSASFSSFSSALGSSYAGDILINGTAVTISQSDSLDDVRDRINNANAGTNPTGVSASIITYGTSDYRLILTSDDTGADGISLQNASSSDLVQLFGWKDYNTSVKNTITSGAQSDSFTSSTQDLKTLLGLSTTQSGNIQIDGNNVAIDLSTDSLEDIKTAINNASITGVTASIVTDTSGSTTTYKLQIDGSQTFTDAQNILETLGVLKDGVAVVQGVTSGNSMTADGEYITASALITQIDGYNQWTSGDKIALGASARDHDGNDISGDILTITQSSTVQDLLDAIETAYEAGGDEVSVYVTSTGKIEIADLATGSSNLVGELQSAFPAEIQDANSSLDWGSFTPFGEVRKREIIGGQDASLVVDGVTVTSSDNTVDDVLPGVTLNLLKADDTTEVTLNIDRDIDAIMEKMSSFVDAYNECSSYIQEQQQSYDEETGEGGVLFGDATLSSVKSGLSTTLLETVWGVSTLYSSLGLVGINVDDEGQLSIDTDTLQGYLETNFNDIRNLFAITGTGSVGTLSYETHSLDTEPGEYTVHITNAATRSTSTSDRVVSGTLGYNETLTITEGDKTARISLTSDMTLAQIKSSVNSELETIYTETLVGSQALTASSSPITSATTWQSIDGTSLVNGDVITFTGTTRGGGTVSGSYTISDVTSDTVQGLLSEIQDDFSNNVTASIDTSGRIVLTDKYSGASQLALSITEPTGRGLDFGDVDVTVGAGDGSQEGRYAMSITATTSGNQLVLTHNNYGDDYSFTISEDTDTGLWTGSQTTAVSVANGEDVAGTIGGETATGAGQKLTGSAGDVEDLVVSYTGTDEDQDIGTVKLTLGVAELFNRILYCVTDQFDGYVPFKQDSLEDSIDRYADEIEQMESRLDRRMQRMINQFVAMEIALSEFQSQSQWLTAQINSSYSGWWGS